MATKTVTVHQNDLTFDDVKSEVTLLGLIGLIDPPREEAIKAVQACHKAGIRVVMITGDHAATAKAIAQQLRIAENPKTLTGNELDSLSDSVLLQNLKEISV
ncbi:MAG TPA: HAD family hydrolase, partial [Candidatus Berkiella sp.]|nr:HAD family hydrolase [Candidatus Berkiella sp.]